MKKWIRFFVDNVLFGDLLTVVVISLGIVTLFKIRREIFPNVNFDIVSIRTVFPAATPVEVEKLITNVIEQELQEVDGIKKIQSLSMESLSEITLFLDPDRVSAEKGKSNIQDVVDRLTGLPEASKKPIVTALESKQAPIIEVSVSGTLDELELRKAARLLEGELEAVPGVARIAFRGLKKLEYHVEADLKKLARYRLSLDDLALALRSQNVTVPGGVIEVRDSAGKEKIVRTKGDFETLEDVQKTVVRANDLGEAIRVRDVARVFEAQERASVLSRTNGLPAIVLTVLQKERTDAIDVVDGVKKRLEEVKGQINPDVKVTLINDFSDFIRRRLSIVTGNLLLGLLFVLLLLPLMIPWRFSLIVALGEPFAFLGTILLLYYTDHSINLISMVGLIIVSGILVDDSIVVTENAVRLVGEGKTPREAAIQGTMQIIAPVTASVLTTTMAFLPMAFMSGIFGKFVREIPIAVLAALSVSLFETFFILPAHVAHWIKPKSLIPEPERKKSIFAGLARFAEKTQRFWDNAVTPKYLSWLSWSIERKYKMLAGLFLFFALSIGVGFKVMKFVLFPPDGVEIFYIQTEAPIGTSLANHASILKDIERKVTELPTIELLDHTTTVGLVQQDPNDPNTQRGSEFGQIMVLLTPESGRSRKADQIIEDMRVKIGTPKGLDRVAMTRVNSGPPVGKAISIGVRGKEYKDILVAVKEIETHLSKMTGVFDVRNTYRLGKEEVRIQVNGAEAAAAGLTVAQVGTSVRAAFEGNVATSIRKLDEEIDVRVSLPEESRSEEGSLFGLMIPNSLGQLIPLKQIASFISDRNLLDIRHEAGRRQVNVTADVDVKVISAIEANGLLKEKLPEWSKKFPGISVAFGGEDEDTTESFQSLGRAFVLAIIGIFLVLVLTFKNVVQPLIVLLTIPLGVISVIWAFILHGLPLSFMGTLGVVALAGVIVNNAIVFTDFVNQARAQGMAKKESLIEAARTRIRPIFLTTVTTVIGILPAAYGIGGEDMFIVPIAMALGWGLMFGSVLTAFVFPAALAVLDDVRGLTQKLRKPA